MVFWAASSPWERRPFLTVPGEWGLLWGSDGICSLDSSAKDSPELNIPLFFLNNTNFSFFKKKAIGALYKQIENKGESYGYFSGKSPRC